MPAHRRTSSAVKPPPLFSSSLYPSAMSSSTNNHPSSSSSFTPSLPPPPPSPLPSPLPTSLSYASLQSLPPPSPMIDSSTTAAMAGLLPLSIISSSSSSSLSSSSPYLGTRSSGNGRKGAFLTTSLSLPGGRKARFRLALLSLFALGSISVYLCFFSMNPTLSYPRRSMAQAYFSGGGEDGVRAHPKPQAAIAKPYSHSNKHHHNHQQHSTQPIANTKPIVLTPAEELAAISSHLASLPQNVIPSTVDPSKSIDPQLVLDFNVREGKRTQEEVRMMVAQTWEHNPVVVYCKHYSPQTRSLRNILSSMDIHPPPTIFEVDLRPDYEVLVPLISRLVADVNASSSSPPLDTSPEPPTAQKGGINGHAQQSLPILLIGGTPISVGDVELVTRLMESGKLRQMILDAGAVIKDKKKKKGKGRR